MQSKLSKQLGVDKDLKRFRISQWVSVIAFLTVIVWLLILFASSPTGHAFFSWLFQ